MFKYIVTYIDEMETRIEAGLIAAFSWGAATEQVRKQYGVDNVVSVTIEEWENCVTFDEIQEGFLTEA